MPCVVLFVSRHYWNHNNPDQDALSLKFRQEKSLAGHPWSSSTKPLLITPTHGDFQLSQPNSKNPRKGYPSANHRSQPLLWIKSSVTNSCLELMFMAGFISCWKAGRIATPWNIIVPVTAGVINCRASSQAFGLSNKRKWLRGKFHHLSFVE